MDARTVSFVSLESIVGVLSRVLGHHMISRDFGHDGRKHDLGVERISLHHILGRDHSIRKFEFIPTVDTAENRKYPINWRCSGE
jgi:hypothetical protein